MRVIKRAESDNWGHQDANGDWWLKMIEDENGRTAWAAARDGDAPEEIKRLVDLEATAFATSDYRGKYMYHFQYMRSLVAAARQGDIDAVTRLLDAGAGVYATETHTSLVTPPIEEAARKGYLEIVAKILEAEKAQQERDGYTLERVQQAGNAGKHDEVARLQLAKKWLGFAQESKDMALQSAAAFGDVAVARSLVEHGADVNAKPDTQHPYALAAAAKGQHFNMVDYLLGLGAEANPPYDGGSRQPPMAAAAEGGSVEIIDKLIAAGGPLDAKKLMRAACAKGHLTVVKRLIEAGAAIDTDRPLSDGERTPLVEAAGGGYVGIVQELLNSGANVNVAAPSRESNALQAAAGSGSLKTVRILLDAGAEVNAPAGTWSRTALQMACHKGHSAIVELLLDAGARFEDDARESTYPALEQAIKGGHLYIADRLLPEMDIRGVDFRGRPCTRALYAAVDMGYEEVVRQLLELGTPTQDGIGHFTEHLVCCAAMKGHTEIVKILLDAGAKMNGEARYRGTALQSAVNGDHLETAKVLLEYGADPDAVQASVEPSLYLAARRGNVEMFELLLDTGANVYTKSYSGKTIRHGAEKHGNAEILRLLDQKEAETAEKPKEDEPLDVSTVTRGRLCGTCEKLPYEVFGSGRRNIETLHPSLTAVRDAAREGCSFCMFLWKQLRVKTVTIPQPSKVSLYQSGGKDGWQVQLDEPYPKDVESPRRLITGFCVIVEPFEEKRKPLPESSSSAQTYAQIQSWLSDCAQNHPKCRLDSGSEFLPTRLLDLRHWKSGKALSLVNSTDLPRSGVSYVTLSHSWHTQRTMSGTTTANLDSRLEGIASDTMLPTVLQAIDVAVTLGIHYLWVDILCILQDSMEDQNRETAMMNDIFRHAYCTIAANVTESDSDGGLFTSRDTNNEFVEFQLNNEAGEPVSVQAMKSQPWWDKMYEEGPLSKLVRGFLERELSPRVLHYTSHQVLWECRTLKASEGLPTGDVIPPSLESQRLLDVVNDPGDTNIYDLWDLTVTKYTERQLPKPDDKFPALSALTKIIAGYTKSEFVAGLWADDLRRGLTWASNRKWGDPHSRHAEYIAPSWSWASVDKGVSFPMKKTTNAELSARSIDSGMAVIHSHNISLATPDPYGSLTSASLEMTAPMISGVLGYDASSNYLGTIIQLRDFSGERILGDMWFDVPSERGNMKVVRMIYLFEDQEKYSYRKDREDYRWGVGLALIAVEGREGVFRRVGHVQDLVLTAFKDIKEEKITLI